MLFLKSDEPSRWQRVGRTARGAGRTARDAGRTAGDAVRTAAAARPRLLRLLIVPVAVGAVVWVVRAVRTRSAAGEEATAGTEATDAGQTPADERRAAPSDRRDLQPSGNRHVS